SQQPLDPVDEGEQEAERDADPEIDRPHRVRRQSRHAIMSPRNSETRQRVTSAYGVSSSPVAAREPALSTPLQAAAHHGSQAILELLRAARAVPQTAARGADGM